MGGNMHGHSFDPPATIVAPVTRQATAVGRIIGLDSAGVSADEQSDAAQDQVPPGDVTEYGVVSLGDS